MRPSIEIDGLLREEHALGARDPAHAQIQIERAQPLDLSRDLREQHAAHRAGPDQPDRQRIGRQIKRRMHGAQRLGGELAVDHHGNVALGGALRDRAHADGRIAERVEHVGGDTVRAGHAVAHHRQDAEAQGHVDVLNLAIAQLRIERAAHRLLGAFGLRRGNRKADRMLGAALRNQDDRDPGIAQRAEQPVGRAGHADHAGALEIDQRHRIDGGDALHLQRGYGIRADQRAVLLGAKVLRM